MFQKKRYLYLSEAEYSILVNSLIQLKNKLIQQNRFTDCVDELLQEDRILPNRENLIHTKPLILLFA